MPDLDLEQLGEDAQNYLDSDPRFFDEACGSFHWHYTVVFFTKLPDWIVLEVDGVEVTVARP